MFLLRVMAALEMGSGLLFGDLFDSLFLWHVRHDFIIQGRFIM
jgi:hypothetical protein